MKILIVGGGIGGLTLGRALRPLGHEIHIVERASAFKPVGAGIVLAANAMRIMESFGLQDELLARGRTVGVGYITTATGRVLSRADIGALRDRHGPAVAIHRGALHEVLVNANSENRLLTGTEPESIEADESGLRVRLSNGEESRYDVVVGADGIRSYVRDALFPRVVPRYSGYTCWRFMLDSDLGIDATYEMWGRGRRFGIVPVGDSKLYCFSTLNAPEADPKFAHLSLDEYREVFSDFRGHVPDILDALEDASQLIHGDLSQVYVPAWQSGRSVLLGDAAHAMTPNLGQGACMAIEDAAVLAEELGRSAEPAEAFAGYETRRRKRVDAIQRQSWNVGRIGQMESMAARTLRNTAVRLLPDSVALRQLERTVGASF